MHLKRILSLVFTAALLVVVSRATAESSARLPRSTPEQQGISSSAILAFVTEAEAKIDALHSFMLVRHGHVVAEGWWTPYAASEPHTLQSLSKSFTSTALGLAIAEGKLSIDDPVIKFFPEEAPANPGKNLSAMRIRDLLRMSTGQAATEHQLNFGFPFRSQQSLVKIFLDLPVSDKPGTHFVYNSAATYVLSAILQKATGETVRDYLKPRLFEPLGITDPQWEASAQGVTFGGFGLSLRTEEIARFGQLYLQRGQWRGRQLVPAAYADEATSLQTANGSNPNSDWDQGYGYQFWRCRHGFYRADGAWGQFCIVMPEFDAVLAITGTYDDMQLALNLVWDRIVPAFQGAALPPDVAEVGKLADKLASLTLKVPAGAATSPLEPSVAGKRYVFPANEQRLESLAFEAGSAGAESALVVQVAGKAQRVVYGQGAWKKSTLDASAGGLVPMGMVAKDAGRDFAIAASGAWTSDNTYTVALCRYQTPFMSTYELTFAGDELVVARRDVTNRSWVKDSIRLTGRASP